MRGKVRRSPSLSIWGYMGYKGYIFVLIINFVTLVTFVTHNVAGPAIGEVCCVVALEYLVRDPHRLRLDAVVFQPGRQPSIC